MKPIMLILFFMLTCNSASSAIEESDGRLDSDTVENSRISNHEQEVLIDKKNKTKLRFYESEPPAWLLWCTVVIALLTLIIRIFQQIMDVIHKSRQKKRSVNDEYWFRKIVLPLCMNPLVEFIENESEEIYRMNSQESLDGGDCYKAHVGLFKAEKEKVSNRFLALNMYDEKLYSDISDEIDNIEDTIVKHCAFKSLGADSDTEKRYSDPIYVCRECYSYLSKIFEITINKHNKFFK